MDSPKLRWQSGLVLLLVVPCTAIGAFLDTGDWAKGAPEVAYWTLGLSAALGLLAWAARSATLDAAATGALITASLLFATAQLPYDPFGTAILPVVTLLVVTSLATRFGRARKERLGTAETRRGRVASQVAANLGLAALVALTPVQIWLIDHRLLSASPVEPFRIFVPALAALAEAAADTVSSELGQVLGGTPRLLTTLRRVAPGTDGGITLAGTLAGIVAAGVVMVPGCWVLEAGSALLAIAWAGGVFGLFFDSLLGATLERKGWLNNDAVNFLSTASAAAFALAALAMLPHRG